MRQLINMLSITTLRPFTESPNHFIDNIHIVSLLMSYPILSSILVTRLTSLFAASSSIIMFFERVVAEWLERRTLDSRWRYLSFETSGLS